MTVSPSCFNLYFSIDAENAKGHICQFVNDATDAQSNAVMKLKIFKNREFLCLNAKRDLVAGEEILYNYGDEKNLWWRRQVGKSSNPC